MAPKKSKSDVPFISVIIPFYNNQEEVIQIEEKLRSQTYPLDSVEFIFIDNGSDNGFVFPTSFLKRNIHLEEKDHPVSPYSARNRGVQKSNGEIIVFVDANSTPERDWLEKGISCIQKTGADLIGGSVDFDFQNQITAGKIVDALNSINMKKAVQDRGVAYTANLFVNKAVFQEVGLFEEGVRSGGDVRWTLKAKQHGFSIDYCGDAVVSKYARSAKKLYRKKIRTGRGYFYTWQKEEERRIWFYNFFRSLKPPAFSSIKTINTERYKDDFDSYSLGIWFHLYASGIVEQLAFMFENFRFNILQGRKHNID